MDSEGWVDPRRMAPPGPPPPVPGPPAGPRSGPPGGRSGRTPLVVAAVVFVLLMGGCGGLGYLVAQLPPPATTTTVPAPTSSTRPAEGDPTEVADVTGCTPLSDDPANYYLLEVTNSAAETVSYDLTVAFYDRDGVNVGTTSQLVPYLRPGERSVEPYTVGPDASWTTCVLVRLDRFRAPSDPAALGRATCAITDTSDFFDRVDGTLTVANDGPTGIAYDGFAAFVDADGVRRSSARAGFDLVGAGETARREISGDLGYDGDLSCIVVGADQREAS